MPVLYPSITGLGGRYLLFRPYIKGVVTSWVAGSTSTLSGTSWRVEGIYTGIDTYQQVTFKSEFLNANTNVYTIDWILTDYFYVNAGGPPLATLSLKPRWRMRPGTVDFYLSLDSLDFPDLYFQDLPPSPAVWP